MSIVSRCSNVADCCSCGAVAVTTVVDCLAAFRKAGFEGSRVPAYPLNVKSQSSKTLPGTYGSGFPTHVLWRRSRHRLSQSSHSICETRHCRVHRSVRRLLPDFFHPTIELLELTSYQLDFLNGCYHHSITPGQDNSLRYHATGGSVTIAMCTTCNSGSSLVMRLGPKTSRCVMSVIRQEPAVASCDG